MPTEITIEVAQKLPAVVKGLSAKGDDMSKADKAAIMRQELPSDSRSTPVEINHSDSSDSKNTIQQEVEELNNQVQNVRRDLHFSVDADSGRTVIRVIDSETRETIRTIPPEEMSVLSQLLEKRSGALFSTSV